MNMRRSYLTAAGLALAVTVWIGSGQFGAATSDQAAGPRVEAAAPAPRVAVRTLSAQPHPREIVVLGRTLAARKVTVRAETAARVVELPLAKGARVDEGDVLARLATDGRLARLSEAEALAEQRRMEYDAARELSEKNFRSRTMLAEAKALLDAARAAVEGARVELARTEIKAPFAGMLDALPVEVGDYLDVGAAVGTVLDLDAPKVSAQVAERDVERVSPGAEAEIELADGRMLAGAVTFAARASANAARTFEVEITIAAEASAAPVPEGMTAKVRLHLGRIMAHRLSPAVLTLDDDGVIGVKAVDAQGRVAFYAVDLVADTPEGIWLSGLPEIFDLITVGQEFVRPGQRVETVADPFSAEAGRGS